MTKCTGRCHWGWVVVAATFVAEFVGLGTVYSSGIYNVAWLDDFQQGSGLTAWIGSITIGLGCVHGPVSGIVVNRWGFRKVVIVSGLLYFVGLFTAVFSPNVYTLMVTYGVIVGIGYGLLFTAASTIVIYYFENCGLALGIATAGGGCGTFIMPMVIDLLIETYGWRGSLLILAGLNLNISVCGALMRSCPNMPHKTRKERKNDTYFEVFKKANFIAHLIHNFLFTIAISVTFVHLVAVIEVATGLRGFASSMTMVVFGLANFIGRFLLGLLVNSGKIDVVTLYSLTYLTFGVTILIMPHVTIYGVLLFMCFILGLSSAPWATLLQLVVKEIVGQDRMMAAYGYSWFSAGIGFILGAPVAGWLYDYTQNYATSLYFGGSSVILSILVMLKFWIDRCRHPKEHIISATVETPNENDRSNGAKLECGEAEGNRLVPCDSNT